MKKNTSPQDNNARLASKNAQLQKSLKDMKTLAHNLWCTHVHDRLRAATMWRDGWKSGFETCVDEFADELLVEIKKTLEKKMNQVRVPDSLPASALASKYTQIYVPNLLKDEIDLDNIPRFPDPISCNEKITGLISGR